MKKAMQEEVISWILSRSLYISSINNVCMSVLQLVQTYTHIHTYELYIYYLNVCRLLEFNIERDDRLQIYASSIVSNYHRSSVLDRWLLAAMYVEYLSAGCQLLLFSSFASLFASFHPLSCWSLGGPRYVIYLLFYTYVGRDSSKYVQLYVYLAPYTFRLQSLKQPLSFLIRSTLVHMYSYPIYFICILK